MNAAKRAWAQSRESSGSVHLK